MLAISERDYELCANRPNTVDHSRVAALHFIGSYARELPVSMARMMENARDWEHLPHVHASSFSDIACIASGRWGWRAITQLPDGETQEQVLELLIDSDKHYWATSILAGPGTGVEIHTRATTLADHKIEIEVCFYNATPLSDEESALFLEVLTQQYALLYDEDNTLMTGRQFALDNQQRWEESKPTRSSLFVGEIARLSCNEVTVVESENGRYCVRRHSGKWIVHSASCPHQLGPLDDATVGADGIVTCPWHGYRFNIESGENLEGKCAALKNPPQVREVEGGLYLIFSASKAGGHSQQ